MSRESDSDIATTFANKCLQVELQETKDKLKAVEAERDDLQLGFNALIDSQAATLKKLHALEKIARELLTKNGIGFIDQVGYLKKINELMEKK